ncbi:pPIWI_RE module domain-containing protein [Okeania sp.]|uniref:pPIWI_RE module domain-containing protein n=1 Tax=Okeania sp. TaxID=3100323 RepID=UPI002B4AEB16|nr:DUF3962 domain-containing protein [Okeania sp.]MEB3341707.1 DUF3962 domain-containing protein [Okeania sp.]
MSDKKILQELIYSFDIKETLPIWYTSFPEELFNNLNQIYQKIKKKNRRATGENFIPVASLNDTIRASSGVLSTGRGIAKEENEILRQYWLMSNGEPIDSESIKLVLLSWLSVEFSNRENFSDEDYELLQEGLESIEPSQKINLIDLPFEKNSLSWKLAVADAIAVKIVNYSQNEPILIGREKYKFIKSPNPGEIQEWPPKPQQLKNSQLKGLSSLCLNFKVGFRYFDSTPKIYIHPSIRRYITEPFEPKYNCAASLHIQAPANYWKKTLPFNRSLQAVSLIKRDGEYIFRNKVLDVLNGLEEGNNLTPEPDKIISAIPQHGIIPEQLNAGNLTVLVLKTTTLLKPTRMEIPKEGLFSHDKRLIFDLFKKFPEFEPTNSLSECDVKVSRNKNHLTEVNPLRQFAQQNKSINILVSIPEQFNRLYKKVEKGFDELKNEVYKESQVKLPINIIRASEDLANIFVSSCQQNDKEKISSRETEIMEMIKAVENEYNCSFDCALIAIQGADYPEYKNGRNDPKTINTKILSKLDIVSQFIVTSYDEIRRNKKTGEEKIIEEKDVQIVSRVNNAISDLMRQLDIPCHKKFEIVKLTNQEVLNAPENLLIVSFFVLRITGKTASNNVAKLMPVITQINNDTGKISLLLMNANKNKKDNQDNTNWLSVKEAQILLASDDLEYVELKDNQKEKALQKVRTFFVENLKNLCENSSKNVLLVVQEDNIRQVIPNLSTEKCCLDELPFVPTGSKSVFDNLRIVIVKSSTQEVSTAYKIWKEKRNPIIIDRELYPGYASAELYPVNNFIYISLGDRGVVQHNANFSKLDDSFKEVKYDETWKDENDQKKLKNYPGSKSWKEVIDNLEKYSSEPYKMGTDYANGCKYQTDKVVLISAQKIKDGKTIYYEQLPNKWSQRPHQGTPVELIVQKVPTDESHLREGWARVVHELRSDSIQYEYSLKVPIILDIPRKLVDYFRLSDANIVRSDSDYQHQQETNGVTPELD